MGIIRPDIKVAMSTIEALSPEMGALVGDLNGFMPETSWQIVELSSPKPLNSQADRAGFRRTIGSSQNVSHALSHSDEVWAALPALAGSRRPTHISPDTWVVGVESSERIQKPGLIVKENGGKVFGGTYGWDSYVREAFGLDAAAMVTYDSLDLMAVTGRNEGTISALLERRYLEGMIGIHFRQYLIELIGGGERNERMVNFPVGETLFYVARGKAFLSGYSRLMQSYGVFTNLPDPV